MSQASAVIQKMKPIHVFVPFTRVSTDDEERVVEGYAFTQEVVKGEGGKRLKRSAMVKATPKYLQEGTVRAMHQPIAAGKPLEVTWDDKGAFIRTYIGDDNEWNKCKTGIYKGFSIGVNALEMRGLDVEECDWFDTSVVDIGKDTGAKFTAWRAENAEEERDCKMLSRGLFAEKIPSLKQDDLSSDISQAYYAFMSCLWSVFYGDNSGAEDKPAILKDSIQEFSDYLETIVDENSEALRSQLEAEISRGNTDPAPPATDPATTETFTRMETEHNALVARVEALTGQFVSLTRMEELQSQLGAIIERVDKIERTPQSLIAPVRNPGAFKPEAIDRAFIQPEEDDSTAERAALETELQQLTTKLQTERMSDEDRGKGIARMQVIKSKLSTL